MKHMFLAAVCGALIVAENPHVDADETVASERRLFDRSNLVAWCIVPFDAKKRSPADRAAMVRRLGLSRVAYDWRAEHVPTFEDEVKQYRRHGIEFFAFWSWHDEFAQLVKKHGIRPQFWLTNPSPAAETQAERVRSAAEELLPVVRKVAALKCQVGLYNHGGWGGEPENLVAVAEYLRGVHGAGHVGIVYNFHHGHAHIERFNEAIALMGPYLLCVNLNGMAEPETVDGMTNKILPIGQGKHEREMIRVLTNSGYSGPIGVLDHRKELDAEQSLRENLDGLDRLRAESTENLKP